MNKEIVSDKQGISLMIMFIVGTSSLVVTGSEAKNDIWIAIMLSIFLAVPVILAYARLLKNFQGKDLFDILEICFSKCIGKILIVLYIVYIFYTGSSVLWIQSHFITTVAFPETPEVIPTIFIGITSVCFVKEGIELMGRWAELLLMALVCFIFALIFLSIPNMEINNITPVLYEGIRPVVNGAFSAFSFPFTMAFSNFTSEKSPYKIYIWALLLGGILILALSLTDILVLGVNSASSCYFPSYASATRINVGNILQRLEATIGIVFILGVFVKFSIYLLAFSKGVSKLFGYTDYRFIVIPVLLLFLNLNYFLYDSLMYFYKWIRENWFYFSFPFHVILPFITLIVVEIRNKRLKTSTINHKY